MRTLSSRLLTACGKGNARACSIAKKINAIFASTSFSFDDASAVKDHPNKMPFEGVLLRVNEASDKPPHGSEFHRIFVSSKTVDEKLPTLIGMGINYDPSDMDSHETKHKVGIITKAGRRGKDVWVKGFVWKRDFPEAEKDLKSKDLGMSMELGNVYVDNENADIWKLDDFDFTGATILKRDAAAYHNTSLSAAAKAAAAEEGAKMPKTKDKKKVAAANTDRHKSGELALLAQAITGSIGTSLSSALNPMVAEIKASNAAVIERLDAMEGERILHAAAEVDEDEDEEIVLTAAGEEDDSSEEDDSMEAAYEEESSDMNASSEDDDVNAAEQDNDSSDDDSSDDDSSESDEGLEAELEDLEEEDASQEPGQVNKDSKNKGSKTKVTKPPKQGEHFKGNVAKGRLAAAKGKGMKKPFPGVHAAAERITELARANRKLKNMFAAAQADNKATVKKFRTKIATMNAQLERFAELEGRRSRIPTELTHLAAKSGINLAEIKAAGSKLSVGQVDAMFAAADSQGIRLEPRDRMGMKNLLIEQGMLEDGVVDRGYGRIQ